MEIQQRVELDLALQPHGLDDLADDDETRP